MKDVMLTPDEHYLRADKLLAEVDTFVTKAAETDVSDEDAEAAMIAANHLVAVAQVHAILATYTGSPPGAPRPHEEDDFCPECGKLLGTTTLDGELVPSCDSCGPVDRG